MRHGNRAAARRRHHRVARPSVAESRAIGPSRDGPRPSTEPERGKSCACYASPVHRRGVDRRGWWSSASWCSGPRPPAAPTAADDLGRRRFHHHLHTSLAPWQGTLTTASPAAPVQTLRAVTCATAGRCWAVGSTAATATVPLRSRPGGHGGRRRGPGPSRHFRPAIGYLSGIACADREVVHRGRPGGGTGVGPGCRPDHHRRRVHLDLAGRAHRHHRRHRRGLPSMQAAARRWARWTPTSPRSRRPVPGAPGWPGVAAGGRLVGHVPVVHGQPATAGRRPRTPVDSAHAVGGIASTSDGGATWAFETVPAGTGALNAVTCSPAAAAATDVADDVPPTAPAVPASCTAVGTTSSRGQRRPHRTGRHPRLRRRRRHLGVRPGPVHGSRPARRLVRGRPVRGRRDDAAATTVQAGVVVLTPTDGATASIWRRAVTAAGAPCPSPASRACRCRPAWSSGSRSAPVSPPRPDDRRMSLRPPRPSAGPHSRAGSLRAMGARRAIGGRSPVRSRDGSPPSDRPPGPVPGTATPISAGSTTWRHPVPTSTARPTRAVVRAPTPSWTPAAARAGWPPNSAGTGVEVVGIDRDASMIATARRTAPVSTSAGRSTWPTPTSDGPSTWWSWPATSPCSPRRHPGRPGGRLCPSPGSRRATGGGVPARTRLLAGGVRRRLPRRPDSSPPRDGPRGTGARTVGGRSTRSSLHRRPGLSPPDGRAGPVCDHGRADSSRTDHHAQSHVRLRREAHRPDLRLLPVEAVPRSGAARLRRRGRPSRWPPGSTASSTAGGTDPAAVMELFDKTLATAAVSVDSPKFLAFIPAAPTKAALLFDMVVACSSLQGTSWIEAAGPVAAENQALGVLADLAGLPEGAGGCFVAGGSAGNLSGLMVGRDTTAFRMGDRRPGATRWWPSARRPTPRWARPSTSSASSRCSCPATTTG